MNDEDLLDPARLAGLDLPPERLHEVAETFETIRREIEKLHGLDREDAHPAIICRPARETSDG